MDFYDDCSFSIPQREFAINSNSVAQPQINQCKIQTHSETKPIPDSIRCQIKLSVRLGPWLFDIYCLPVQLESY